MLKVVWIALFCVISLHLSACGGGSAEQTPVAVPPASPIDDDKNDDGEAPPEDDESEDEDSSDDAPPAPAPEPVFWSDARTTMFLLPNRIDELRSQLEQDDTALKDMRSWLDTYLETVPYNSSEYAQAYALAYHLTGNERYLKQATTLLWREFFSDPDVGWPGYKNRNGFRNNGNKIAFSYDWLRFSLSVEERSIAEKHFATWVEYWLDYTKYQADFTGYRFTDTDETVAIVENLTLFGYLLQTSTEYQQLGALSLTVADQMLDRFVVNHYMKDIMAGGAWAEGSDYSPMTQLHWIRTFLVNKELRGLPFPTDYAEQTALSLIHQTLAGDTGVFQYGSVEQGQDYRPVLEDGRYKFILYLLDILQGSETGELLHSWFENKIRQAGHLRISIYPGLERVLLHNTASRYSDIATTPTLHHSPGVGLVAIRNNWSAEATNLFMLNRRIRVDHEHADALNFDLAHRGVWITKQVTGYSGAGALGNAHNSILIENATAEGSSNPISRAVGDGFYRTIYQDNHLAVISAEAAAIYNMSGFYQTQYAESVNRQLALVGQQTLVVFDTVRTRPEQINDLIRYQPQLGLQIGDEYIRKVSVNQFFQSEPQPDNQAPFTYYVKTEEMHAYYQIAWPDNVSVRKINGQELWANQTEYAVPTNQRKWHLQISSQQPQKHSEFLTFLDFEAAKGKPPLIYSAISPNENLLLNENFAPQQKWLLNQENGMLNSALWFGVGFEKDQIVVLFSRNPARSEQSYLEITLPDSTLVKQLYILGWQPGSAVQVKYDSTNAKLEIHPDNTNKQFIANNEGLLRIQLQ